MSSSGLVGVHMFTILQPHFHLGHVRVQDTVRALFGLAPSLVEGNMCSSVQVRSDRDSSASLVGSAWSDSSAGAAGALSKSSC